jgi:hypothetical protein
MNDQDVLSVVSCIVMISTHKKLTRLWLQVAMCKGLGVHDLQSQKYLLRNVSCFRLRYFPRAGFHVIFEISKRCVFHCQENIGSVSEPAQEINEHRGFGPSIDVESAKYILIVCKNEISKRLDQNAACSSGRVENIFHTHPEVPQTIPWRGFWGSIDTCLCLIQLLQHTVKTSTWILRKRRFEVDCEKKFDY